MAKRPTLGEALREAMSAGGRELELADARRLALALLDLAEAGLLGSVPESEDGRPHVYNMGPSNCRTAPKEAS